MKTMKKTLGIILAIIFIGVFFAIFVSLVGWAGTLFAFGLTAFSIGAIALCMWLLLSD